MSTSNVENLAPHVIRRVTKELAELVTKPPEGIKIIPNDEDVSDIQAIVEGPAGTPYHKGYFRVKLVLGKTFPLSPPKGFFLTKIFHPNVSRTGEICVNTLKKDWKEDLGIKHILLIVKCLLIVPNAESALNEEAAKLLLEHYDEYCKRAKMITEIHAKPSEKEKMEPVDTCHSASSKQSFSRKHPESDSVGSVPKRLAKNTNNIRSTLGPAKQINSKDNRKRTLKRL